jgi:hypothetical protein
MNQVLGFGAFVLGAAVVALMVIGCLASSKACMGAAVILGVPFMAVVVIAILRDLDARDGRSDADR